MNYSIENSAHLSLLCLRVNILYPQSSAIIKRLSPLISQSALRNERYSVFIIVINGYPKLVFGFRNSFLYESLLDNHVENLLVDWRR